ncbi:MAG: Crp/Fnr family transcriptional regulator [Chitinophagales bacterium]|nr:Crp/Fnr family transcriptional regulator [Chitinophagales bacterium]
MHEHLKSFLNSYVTLPDDVQEKLVLSFKQKVIAKNDFLLQKEQICKDLVFVNSGCLRMYYIQHDVEISVWFALAQSSAIEIYSFISEQPTQYYIQAIEDTEVLYLPKTVLENLYIEFPILQQLMRKYWEDVILHLLERFTALQRDDAETRYLDLLDKPTLLQSIPQKYLASFIGVTPTSLSRIKRKIAKQNF